VEDVAKDGVEVEAGKGRYHDMGKTTKFVTPEAVVAHEMAEAKFKRDHKDKDEYKNNPKKLQEDAHQAGIEAEDKVMKEQKKTEEEKKKAEEKKKKEEEEKKKKGGEKYPGDPDNSDDYFQTRLANNLLTKILKTETSLIHDQGPVIKIQTEGISGRPRWVFVFNPFYKGPDPMKQIIWKQKNADGTWGFVRNPFAAGGAPTWSNTYEKFQQSGFVQPEVDPYY